MENTIILKSTIVPRNDISTNWNIQKPILVRGELGLESDTNQIKIGDGLNNWDKLNYIISSIKNDDIDVIIGGDVPEPPVEPTDPSKLWVYGLKAPAESNWKQLFPGMYDSYWLPWKEEYGWPGVNKVNPTAADDGYPDGLMCWAATASNMIHWWCKQNEQYIKQYNYTGPDYHWPLESKQESAIFQVFIDSFKDEAGYIDAGVNWFMHGDIPSSPPQDPNPSPGGYFKDVFPDGVKLGKLVKGLSKETFSQALKYALENKQAIGFIAGPARSSHAMTIWGAEFDEDGYASYIYMVDNNDRDQFEALGLGLCRAKIVYKKLPEGVEQPYYDNGFISGRDASTAIVITSLTTLDLGTQYWEDYIAKHGSH